MSQDTIESLRARVAELEAEADPEALHIAYLHGQADRNQQLAAKDQRIAELEEEIENEQARGIHSCHPGCLRDGCVNRRLRDQLAAQALTIKTMREALDASPSGIHQLPGGDCSCSQCEFVRLRKRALAIPDNSTEVLQAWLDKQLDEPVSRVTVQTGGHPFSAVISDELVVGTKLYRKPEIK